MSTKRFINAAGLEIIKRNEGLKLSAYLDIANIPTIGWGHTPATMGTSISLIQAEQLLAGDVGWAEDAVAGATDAAYTSDNQFSAMVSLAFNIGAGAFRSSTTLKCHRARDYAYAANAFLFWNKARVDGELRTVTGLLRRRGEERALYLKDDPLAPAIITPPDINGLNADKELELVAQLQQALIDANYYHGAVDRDFGTMSYAALRKFTVDHHALL